MARRKGGGRKAPAPKAGRSTTSRLAPFVPLAVSLVTAASNASGGTTLSAPVKSQAGAPAPFVEPAGPVIGSLPANFLALSHAVPRLQLEDPAGDMLESWTKPSPQKSSFGGCGWFGSEGSDKPTNLRKNRTDLPPAYHAVSFEAITNLDVPEASTRRDKWTQAQLDVIEPFEGEAVTVTGFIAAFRAQANNSESTNCGQKGEAKTDWHIALVGEHGSSESEAIVVETTPRIKVAHPKWITARFKALVGSSDSVRVSGYLLLDPVHKNHLGKFRQTLWEVHPIHRIEIFENGKWHDVDDDP